MEILLNRGPAIPRRAPAAECGGDQLFKARDTGPAADGGRNHDASVIAGVCRVAIVACSSGLFPVASCH